MDQQQLTRKQAMGGLIVGLILGIVPGILLYYGGKIFPGTGGSGIPPDPNYGTKTAQSLWLFLFGSLYSLLMFILMFAILFLKTLRRLRLVCYGMAISLALSLPFARILVGSWVWYGAIILLIVPLVFSIEKASQWMKQAA